MKLPHNLAMERTVLGAMIAFPECIDTVAAKLVPEHFYKPAHAKLFAAVMLHHREGEPADLAVLHDYFKTSGELEEIGGLDYLSGLLSDAITGAGVERHAAVILEHAMSRRVIEKAKDITAKIEAGEMKPSEAASTMRSVCDEVDAANHDSTPQAAHEQWYGRFRRLLAGKVPFVPTGIELLDAKLAEGLAPGKISIWFGRPGAGKTTLMAHLCRNLAGAGVKVTAFPNETGEDGFMDMCVCGATATPILSILKTPEVITDEQHWAMRDAALNLRENLTIMPPPIPASTDKWTRPNMAAMDAFESSVMSTTAQVVMVDLLDITFDSLKPQDVSVALSRLRVFVRRNARFHVALFHQASRATEDRKDDKRRPQLTDLKGSGKWEETGDLIIGLYRPKYYYPEIINDRMELQILKQRLGMPAGPIVACDFDGARCRIIGGESCQPESTEPF